MTVILVILIGLIAFLTGYALGDFRDKIIPQKKKKPLVDSETQRLIEEYRNFLNYNGDEQ